MRQKNFSLFFPYFRTDLLKKDVGIIPIIYKNYLGYSSSILCTELKGEENSVIETGLKLFYEKDSEEFMEQLAETDILFLIGYYDYNLWMIELYRKLNAKGKIYLKLDMNPFWFQSVELNENSRKLLESCDLISVECKKLQPIIQHIWSLPIAYIPNGYYNLQVDRIIGFEEKENTILTVGRIGAPEKASEMLLYSFVSILDKIPKWRLKFIGPVEREFEDELNHFMQKYPELKARIQLYGAVYDNEILENEYAKAKIFTLTSNSEGFPNVFPEAAIKGCYIVSTDLPPAYDITKDGKYGSIVPAHDINSLARELLYICEKEDIIRNVCYATQIHCRLHFDFIKLCLKIESLLFQL